MKKLIPFALLAAVAAALRLKNGPLPAPSSPPVGSGTDDAPARTYAGPPADPGSAAARTDFAFRLFETLRKAQPEKNLFVSPLSVSLAVSMAHHGAAGETAKALAAALGLPDTEQADKDNAALLAELAAADPKVQLAIADSAWGRDDVAFLPDYVKRNRDYYGARAEALDFGNPASSKKINDWVAEKTMGKIPQIVGPLGRDEILLLINAIYFKGSWTRQFQSQRTRVDDFTPLGGAKKQVKMMHQTARFPYFQGEGFQAISLPYGSGRLSMVILLPEKGAPLDAFYAQLTARGWEDTLSKLEEKEVVLSLPRFKQEYSASLRTALSALGMGAAFDKDKADFTRMVDLPKSGLKSVWVSDVIHKTFVELNEEGTEAAAVTAVHMSGIRAAKASKHIVFTVDHPFFCAIRDGKTGALLFAGSIVDP